MRNEFIATDRQWYGIMTIENVEAIAVRIKKMLTGKYYTFVANNFYSDYPRPEVHTSQQMETDPARGKDVQVWYDDKENPPRFAGFHVGDTYGVWGTSTHAREDDRASWEKQPYIVLDYRQIKIEHYAPAGHLLIWVIMIEHHEGEDWN